MSQHYSNLPVAYPYVPPQRLGKRYSDEVAIVRGTLFPELDLPFKQYEKGSTLPKTQMTQVMMLDFVCFELRLYLDTHPSDTAAFNLYSQYHAKATEAKKMLQDTLDSRYHNSWVYSPWPWEGEV